jgi:ABC-type nitrate/sulfonate/bicarbonate transport system ATPase subunit
MFDYMTVAQNLQIAGKMGGLSKGEINEKATGYIELFGLREHLAKYPRDLSGGTKQRVAIVRQLMCATNYMVMDEPFSGLDPIMKARAQEAIVKLSQLDEYNTVIIVTHDVTEGLTVSDTCWMMGYDKDAVGNNILGARIVAHLDLADLGFAWRPDLERDPKFLQFVREVKDKFRNLK